MESGAKLSRRLVAFAELGGVREEGYFVREARGRNILSWDSHAFLAAYLKQ